MSLNKTRKAKLNLRKRMIIVEGHAPICKELTKIVNPNKRLYFSRGAKRNKNKQFRGRIVVIRPNKPFNMFMTGYHIKKLVLKQLDQDRAKIVNTVENSATIVLDMNVDRFVSTVADIDDTAIDMESNN